MKSEPTEKPRGKKTAASETADRKNGRSPSPGHDEWWIEKIKVGVKNLLLRSDVERVMAERNK